MAEIDLLCKYPKTTRDLKSALAERTEEARRVARRFDKEFFDGERKYGYGGFSYNPKYWTDVVKDFVKFYKLTDGSRILDVGCGKGFMLYDFYKNNKNFYLEGIDISNYAIKNCMQEVKSFVKVGSALKLDYEDNSFDLIISINTIHNLEIEECAIALQEIERVSKKHKFVVVDAYKNDDEKKRMFAWNLTAKTIMHVDDWIKFFKKNNYTGDYYWFTP